MNGFLVLARYAMDDLPVALFSDRQSADELVESLYQERESGEFTDDPRIASVKEVMNSDARADLKFS